MRLRKKGTNSERRVIRWETELITKALKAGLAVTIDNTHLGRKGANFFHSHGDHPVVVRGILAWRDSPPQRRRPVAGNPGLHRERLLILSGDASK
jgi:hypothetical protein